jgi:hypothetical protein
MRDGWRRIAFAVGAILSGLVVVYVLYTHVLSASRMAADSPQDFRESFGATDGLPRGYTVKKRGGLGFSARGGVLTVEGQGAAGDELVFTTPPRRFDDSLITLRFRSRSNEPLEIFVGLEENGGKRDVAATYTFGPTPFVRLGGDISGPYRSGQAVEDVRVDGGIGDDWHTLSFQFAPRYSSAAALLDGKPLISTAVLWPQGVDSRIAFGVRARGDAKASVEIDSLTFRTMDDTLASFDDTFNGEILDSQRWIAQYPDMNLADFDLHLAKGKGLVLDGSAKAMAGDYTSFYFVRTPPFPLRSFHATADVTVETAKDARVFFGMIGSSSWTTMDKVFDVGVSEGKDKAIADVTGAWMNTGALTFEIGPENTLPHRYLLEVSYDARTVIGTGTVDGKVVTRHGLDLKPLDLVSLRIGSGGHAVGAHSRVIVHRISYEMR